jgi:hypothetical protein
MVSCVFKNINDFFGDVKYTCGDFSVVFKYYPKKNRDKKEYTSCYGDGCLDAFLYKKICKEDEDNNLTDKCENKQLIKMKEAVAASGSKYESKKYNVVFREKGGESFLEEFDKIYYCK